MSFKIKTEVLKGMMTKAVKGAGNNKLLPITGLINFEVTDGLLTLTTTDGNNTLKVKERVLEGNSFFSTLAVDLISKLIAKTTTETMTFTQQAKNEYLLIQGNGSYKIELPLDSEGNMIKFPGATIKEESEKKETTLDISKILKANKQAVSKTFDSGAHLTGYYFDTNRVITTDSYQVCINEIKTLDKNILLPAATLELLSLFEGKLVSIQQDEDKLLFTADTLTLFCTQLENIEQFPASSIDNLIENEFGGCCIIEKGAILEILNRMTIFTTAYDVSAKLEFTEKGIEISSRTGNGIETLNYVETKTHIDFSCYANLEFLIAQITSQEEEKIELYYGNKGSIKLKAGNITQIIALRSE